LLFLRTNLTISFRHGRYQWEFIESTLRNYTTILPSKYQFVPIHTEILKNLRIYFTFADKLEYSYSQYLLRSFRT